VRRTRTWDEVSVRLDAVELGPTNKAALREGVEYKLYDHSVLRLWLEPGPRDSFFLMITRNGHPLPESDGDPVKILRFTLSMIGVVAGLQIFIGLGGITHERGDAEDYWAVLLGVALVILGLFAWHRSIVAMVAACALFTGELVVFLFTETHVTVYNFWNLPFAFGLLGWLLWRGIKAVRELKAAALPIRHPPEHPHSSDAA
jgi:lysylphosphatidylglycerol synthetase-like protein (DUF2156 family)